MYSLIEIAQYFMHVQAFLFHSQTALLSPRLKMMLHLQVHFTPHVDDTIYTSLHKRGAKRVLR